jgi:hypothetical protein
MMSDSVTNKLKLRNTVTLFFVSLVFAYTLESSG